MHNISKGLILHAPVPLQRAGSFVSGRLVDADEEDEEVHVVQDMKYAVTLLRVRNAPRRVRKDCRHTKKLAASCDSVGKKPRPRILPLFPPFSIPSSASISLAVVAAADKMGHCLEDERVSINRHSSNQEKECGGNDPRILCRFSCPPLLPAVFFCFQLPHLLVYIDMHH